MRCATFIAVFVLACEVAAEQAAFEAPHIDPAVLKKRPLKGRFLHLTDIHPDPHYKEGATFESGCHRKPKEDKGKARAYGERPGEDDLNQLGEVEVDRLPQAGKWGSGITDCDSPMSLVDHTFDYLAKNWAHEIDFVIWTGDNARHDIDRSLPRTPKEIFESNRMMVKKMKEAFPHIPIVPSIGNNDIYPHNVLAPGPNKISEEFLKIWKSFIGDEDRHVFERGVYFGVEVIPDRLAVISLNTLYWYDSNTLVDGCRDNSRDPGALQLDWLEVQLDQYRERGMQVWLSGHVPPHLGHYYDTCYLRYGDLALRYQDTIVGHVFGHMNVDHFFFIDVQELEATAHKISTQNSSSSREFFSSAIEPGPFRGPIIPGSSRYRIQGRSANAGLQDELRKDFGDMPGPNKLKMKDYAVMNVAPSVIPTYLPGLRVYSYNISGVSPGHEPDLGLEIQDEFKKRKGGHRHGKPKDDCSRPENQDKPHCSFAKKPRYYDSTSPSRRNGPLTPLGYAQFYLPDVDEQEKSPEWKIEYTTYKKSSLLPPNMTLLAQHPFIDQPPPIPYHMLPGWDEAALQDTEGEALKKKAKREKLRQALKLITPWRMKDLTIPSYVRLARKLVAEKRMWNKFQEIMFVSSDT